MSRDFQSAANGDGDLLGREYSLALILFHQSVAERLGLNVTDYKVLSIIPDEGVTAGEIAVAVGLSTGMVTTVVDRLERKGFVYRDKHPDDRRKVVIKKNGAKQAAELGPIFRSFGLEMGKVFAKYSEREIAAIVDFLKESMAVFKEQTRKLSGEKR